MLLNALRVISPVLSRTNLANSTVRANQIYLPVLSSPARTYSHFADDDEDQVPTRKVRTRKIAARNVTTKKVPTRKVPTTNYERQNYISERFENLRNERNSNREPIERPGLTGSLTQIDWNKESLNEFKKNSYEPSEVTQNRNAEEIRTFQEEHEITISRTAPKPIFSFNELQNLPSNVMNVINNQNFSECTPIQAQGLPIALSGKNMVGIAQTGSGKTLAYILPAIIHILNQKPLQPGDGPIVLILAPTRELAQQIQEVVKLFGESSNIRNACLYGGADKTSQMEEINRGCELVVATPGRLIDLIGSGELNLRRTSYLVLDEADRMLDMGFGPQLREVLSQIRPDRQTLMWSATWPMEVRRLALAFMVNSDCQHVTVGSTELCANRNIKQNVILCEERDKPSQLLQILKSIYDLEKSEQKTLIFSETKRAADQIARNINREGYKAEAIHSDRTQSEREKILKGYRNGNLDILVATDVASRGLDVSNIKHVINYDYPKTTLGYIHRIGRTGRSKSSGTAYTFFTSKNVADNNRHASELINVLKEAKQEVPKKLLEFASGTTSVFERY